jgi:predicted permease
MSFYELFTTFSNNILPIIFVAGGGYLLGKFLSVDPRTVGRLVFYLFSPVLIFDLLTSNRLPVADVLLTGAFTTSIVLGTGLLAFIGGSLLHLERPTLAGVTIAAMFANNGNYGLPLVKFAFGNEALAHSSLYFVFSTILLNTVGVIIASLGHTDFKRAALGLVRVPAVYAVLIAFLVIQFGITIPVPVQRTISIMAGASVPMMLVLLGLELQRAHGPGTCVPFPSALSCA